MANNNPSLFPDKNFVTIRKVCGGIQSIGDAQDNTDDEVSDSLNMVFRNGFPEARSGSKLKWSFPAGETNALLDLFRARDSRGNEYPIAVYAPNFYLRDETNNQWIKINNNYNPSAVYKTSTYSYVNWDSGISSPGPGCDTLYAGNGKEDCVAWPIILQTLSVAALSTDTTITVSDAGMMPSSAYIVLKESGGTEVYTNYTVKTGNVLTLSGALGVNVASGASVSFQIRDASTVIRGNILAKSNGRLFVAGKPNYENIVYFSVINNPEDFTTTGHSDSSGNKPIIDGNGGLTSVIDFGEYVLVQKPDSAYKLIFSVDQSLDSFLINVIPVFSDISMGPISPHSVIKKNNILYFPTPTEGIYSMSPGITGQQTSVQTDILSIPIQDMAQEIDFTNSKAIAFNQFLLFTGASSTISDKILVYDIIRSVLQQKKVWTKFDNWSVKCWLVHNDNELLFGNRIDNNIYQAFGDDFVDLETSTSQTPYMTSFVTKIFDYGYSQNGLGRYPSKLKRSDLLHVQGYMTTGTINVDIMFNENGRLSTITRSWSSSDDLVYQVKTLAEAMMMLGLPLSGGTVIDDLDGLGVFNFYIPLPPKIGYSNITFKFYSNSGGISWGLSGHGWNPALQIGIPTQLTQLDTQYLSISTTTSIPPSVNSSIIPVKRWVFDYTPAETVNGVTTVFTVPAASQVVVFPDGNLAVGRGVDYSFTSGGTSITFTAGRQPFSSLSVSYLPL